MFFGYFIEYYKDGLNLPGNQKKHIIGLSKTKWIDRHHVYDTHYLLFKATVFTFESIFSSNLYNEF